MYKKSQTSIIVGHIDSSIGKVLKHHHSIAHIFSWVLLTCIDSSIDLRSIHDKKILIQHFDGVFLGKSIYLPRNRLVEAAHTLTLFSGFDELWFFERRPTIIKPVDLWITAPVNLAEKIPPKLTDWINISKCSLGLGDGIGLNYVTTSRQIENSLKKI